MANRKGGGLINRILMGSEKSEGYARATMPSNRWELFWDIFKGRFWKLVLINVLMLLFLLPLIGLFVLRYMAISGYGATMPFSQGFGVAYQTPSLVGISESVVFSVDIMFYLFMPLVLAIAAVGVSGGAYVIRNMVWTEGIFVANDFWRGIKQNIKQILAVFLLYSVVFYVTVLSIALADQSIATGAGAKWMFVVSKILSITILLFYSIMTMHMITMSVTYELKLTALIKNSFLFTLGLLPTNLLFIFLGALPVLLIFIGVSFITAIGIMLILLIAVSFALLIWTNYCQWAYDKFINDKVEGAKKNRGIYEKVKETNSEALKQYRKQVAMTRTSLNSRPIKPITDDDLKLAELPTSFNRDDIIKLNESKQAIYDDHAKYVEEHKNDPEFMPTEEEIAAKKADEDREKRIEKAKKELMKRNKGQK